MTEEWRPVVGYEGFYEVSDLGRVRSVSHVVKARYNATATKRGRLIRSRITDKKRRYLRITLSRNNVIKTHLVHRLVASAFVTNPKNKPCINHKNGNKEDNRPGNLEWVTHKENTHHAIRHGLINERGENSALARLTSEDARQIRFLSKFMSQRKIGLLFGVNQTHVSHIVLRKAWAHIV